MRTLRTPFVGMALAAGIVASSAAQAAPKLRTQVNQRGDFLLIGNTFGWDCNNEPPKPDLGDIGLTACTGAAFDTAPDLFWRADVPEVGKATAESAYLPSDTRTTANLELPSGATVTHAYLFWAARKGGTDPVVTQALIERVGSAGFQQAVVASATYNATSGIAYQSVAEVTDLVRQNGSGLYRVSGINVAPFSGITDDTLFGAWAMVVFYERSSEPLRNLALFEGMDLVGLGNPQSVTLSGFQVPNSGCEGKLGVIAYEGDASMTGDKLFFGGGDPLSDSQNQADNFFNSTRSWLGSPRSVDGDLPRLKGIPKSMAGVDLDVVDITAKLLPGQTQAQVQATSDEDEYYLGAFVTSITPFEPDFATTTKTVRDVNGAPLLSGDILEYRITLTNTGNDAAVRSTLTDPLPAGVTYVDGSLAVSTGVGNIENGYDPAGRRINARLGAGATATQGGTIPVGGSVAVTFQVKVDPGKTGTISNQATVSAAGERGAPETSTFTDGNGLTTGSQSTDVFAEQCDTNAQCNAPMPICDPSVSPRVCVACIVDENCGAIDSGKVCSGRACAPGCRGAGGNHCPSGQLCSSNSTAIGQCVECLSDSDCGAGKVCDPASNTCKVGCRGIGGNECPDNLVCTSMDTNLGMCVECLSDAQCGTALSGRICNQAHTCQDGCRGVSGNSCPAGVVCTSVDANPGACVQCMTDAHCGAVTSGKVCDESLHACRDGCRAVGGNGCPADNRCSSVDTKIGYCSGIAGSPGTAGQAGMAGRAGEGGVTATGGRSSLPTANWNDIVAQGNGCTCRAISNTRSTGVAGLLTLLLATAVGRRRRRVSTQ